MLILLPFLSQGQIIGVQKPILMRSALPHTTISIFDLNTLPVAQIMKESCWRFWNQGKMLRHYPEYSFSQSDVHSNALKSC